MSIRPLCASLATRCEMRVPGFSRTCVDSLETDATEAGISDLSFGLFLDLRRRIASRPRRKRGVGQHIFIMVHWTLHEWGRNTIESSFFKLQICREWLNNSYMEWWKFLSLISRCDSCGKQSVKSCLVGLVLRQISRITMWVGVVRECVSIFA
ncbi:hypothetical protein GOBAR_DD13822 [Gossypium barbadense]|nr:hypothetical protein GOBAR_DD13822 [Gossypium barbadense]